MLLHFTPLLIVSYFFPELSFTLSRIDAPVPWGRVGPLLRAHFGMYLTCAVPGTASPRLFDATLPLAAVSVGCWPSDSLTESLTTTLLSSCPGRPSPSTRTSSVSPQLLTRVPSLPWLSTRDPTTHR